MNFGSKRREKLAPAPAVGVSKGKKKKWQQESSSSSGEEITREDFQRFRERDEEEEQQEQVAPSPRLSASVAAKGGSQGDDSEDDDSADSGADEPLAGVLTSQEAKELLARAAAEKARRQWHQQQEEQQLLPPAEDAASPEQGDEHAGAGSESPEDLPVQSVSRTVDVPQATADQLETADRKGLRELAVFTRCEVNLYREGPEGLPRAGQVAITGPPVAAECALDLLQTWLAECPGSNLSGLLDKVPTLLYERAVGLGGASPRDEKFVAVSAQKKGLLRGPEGSTLRRLQDLSCVAVCELAERESGPVVHISGSHSQVRECEGIVKRLIAGDYYGMGFQKLRVPIRPVAALRKLTKAEASCVPQVEALGDKAGCCLEVRLEPEELLDDDEPCIVVSGPPQAVAAAVARAAELLASAAFQADSRSVQLPAGCAVGRWQAGGAAVEEVAEVSGCRVEVDNQAADAGDEGAPPILLFSGSASAVEAAAVLVEVLSRHPQPEGGGGGLHEAIARAPMEVKANLTILLGASPLDGKVVDVPPRCKGLLIQALPRIREMSKVTRCSLESTVLLTRVHLAGLRSRVAACEKLILNVVGGDASALGFESNILHVSCSGANKLMCNRPLRRCPAEEMSGAIGCAITVDMEQSSARVSIVGPAGAVQAARKMIDKFIASESYDPSEALGPAYGELLQKFQSLTGVAVGGGLGQRPQLAAPKAVGAVGGGMGQRSMPGEDAASAARRGAYGMSSSGVGAGAGGWRDHAARSPPDSSRDDAGRRAPSHRGSTPAGGSLPPPPAAPAGRPGGSQASSGGQHPLARGPQPHTSTAAVWERRLDPKRNLHYYWNHLDGSAVWHPPMTPAGQPCDFWEMFMDAAGRPYFSNVLRGESAWSIPVPARSGSTAGVSDARHGGEAGAPPGGPRSRERSHGEGSPARKRRHVHVSRHRRAGSRGGSRGADSRAGSRQGSRSPQPRESSQRGASGRHSSAPAAPAEGRERSRSRSRRRDLAAADQGRRPSPHAQRPRSRPRSTSRSRERRPDSRGHGADRHDADHQRTEQQYGDRARHSGGDRHGGNERSERHTAERHDTQRNGSERHGAERHATERHGADRHGAERHGEERHGAERHGAERYGAERHGADRHGSERQGGERFSGSDRQSYDHHGGERQSRERERHSDQAAHERGAGDRSATEQSGGERSGAGDRQSAGHYRSERHSDQYRSGDERSGGDRDRGDFRMPPPPQGPPAPGGVGRRSGSHRRESGAARSAPIGAKPTSYGSRDMAQAKRGVAMCPKGHPLEPLGTTNDNGWSCSGQDEPGGCRSGTTGFDETTGMNRFRCATCDYDLCEACHEQKPKKESDGRAAAQREERADEAASIKRSAADEQEDDNVLSLQASPPWGNRGGWDDGWKQDDRWKEGAAAPGWSSEQYGSGSWDAAEASDEAPAPKVTPKAAPPWARGQQQASQEEWQEWNSWKPRPSTVPYADVPRPPPKPPTEDERRRAVARLGQS